MHCFRTTRVSFLALFLTLASGCARQSGVQTPEQGGGGPSADEQSLPFDQQGEKTGRSLVPASEVLPIGTPIAVRLQSAISSGSSRSGEHFEAVVDDAVVIDGRTVLARGTKIEGRVLAAKASGRPKDPGYLRLTLSNLLLNDVAVPVRTNSIFVKGGSYGKRSFATNGGAGMNPVVGAAGVGNKGALVGTGLGTDGAAGKTDATVDKNDVSLSAKRRLTFRLAQPISVGN